MDEKGILVTGEELENYIFEKLVNLGFAITEFEAGIITDVVFDFLIEKGVLEELKN